MPSYHYEAIAAGGQKSSGVLEAESPRDARRLLRQQSLQVLDLTATSYARRSGASLLRLRRFNRSKVMAVEAVTRQLALLLENEVKLTDALNIAMEDVADKTLLVALRDMRDRVANGSSVAEAMDPHEWIFGQMYISMIRVGETSGTLPGVLKRQAEFMRERATRQGQLSAVMIYPIVMFFFVIGVVTFLMIKVVPNIQSVLDSFHEELPLPTQVLMGVYHFFGNFWWLIIILLVLSVFGLISILKTDKGRRLRDNLLLRVPVLGDLIRKQQTVHFTSTLRTLLASGVKMADCMAVLLETTHNMFMRDTINDLRESIMRGSDVSTVLRRSHIIPRAVAHMVAVGEQSGELEEVLGRLSGNLNAEVEITLGRLNALLQPVLVLGMALAVGFVVAAIMLPIFKMSNIQ